MKINWIFTIVFLISKTMFAQIANNSFENWNCYPNRASLIYGTYEPDHTTTGVPSCIVLTPYNTSGETITITQDNTVLSELEIFGDIRIQAKNVLIERCYLRGGTNWPATATGVVDCNSASCYNAIIRDCTIKPDRPSYYRDGIVGHEYQSIRNQIYNTNDGLGIFNRAGKSDDANVKAYGNYIHSLVYWYPEPAHDNATNNDGTHNDCIQIQGGRKIHIKGNRLKGTSLLGDDRGYNDPDGPTYSGGALSGINPIKPTILTQPNGPHINGSVILIQNNTGGGLDSTVIVEENFISNGLTGANLKDGLYVFRNNKFYRNSFYLFSASSSNHYPLRPTSAITAAKIIDLNTNKYTDNGEILTTENGGIRY